MTRLPTPGLLVFVSALFAGAAGPRAFAADAPPQVKPDITVAPDGSGDFKTVQAALDNTVLLRADVTKNDELDQALMKHFGIFGPPTIAFYDAKGTEQRNYRVVGYMKAGEFADLLRKALGGS